MILFKHIETVLITPPATASVSLHETLCGAQFGGVWCVGPAGDEVEAANQHTCCLDPAHRGWRRVVVVRNPFDRLVSLYHKLVSEHLIALASVPSFGEFVRHVEDGRRELHWMYRWSITQLLGSLRVDGVVRFESLNADLTQLVGISVDLPRLNATSHEAWETHFADPIVRLTANQWAEADVRAFGYERLN